MQNSGGGFPGEGHEAPLQESVPAVAQAHHLEAQLRGPTDDGADDGVEAGTVSAAGENGEPHRSYFVFSSGKHQGPGGRGPPLGARARGARGRCKPGRVHGQGLGAERHHRQPDGVREDEVQEL